MSGNETLSVLINNLQIQCINTEHVTNLIKIHLNFLDRRPYLIWLTSMSNTRRRANRIQSCFGVYVLCMRYLNVTKLPN